MIKKLEAWLRKIISEEVKQQISEEVKQVEVRLAEERDKVVTKVNQLSAPLNALVSHTEFLAKAKAQELARQGHKVTK